MPILKDFRQTKEISLPSFPDSKVVIYDSMIVGQMSAIDFKSTNEIAQIIQSLPLFIKSWNFTDEDGKDMEVNQENLGFMKMEDLQYLGEQIMAFAEEVKKKANNSQP